MALTAREIQNIVKRLALSQGFYGRLLESIESAEDPDAEWQKLADQNLNDEVDLVLFIESC